jgi:hypothetical protein
MPRTRPFALLALLALLAPPTLAGLGCAPRYAYLGTTSATVEAPAGAVYVIPGGDVSIASYGVTDVWPTDRPADALHALHLRVSISNRSTTPWTFDTADSRLVLRGGDVLAPAFASADSGPRPPLVVVSPEGERVADLFFLLPPSLQRAQDLPTFDALWQLQTSTGVVTERTPFARLVMARASDERSAGDYGPGYPWGGTYWVNPSLTAPWNAKTDFGAGAFIRLAPRDSPYQFSFR